MHFKLVTFFVLFCLTSAGFSQTISVTWPKQNEILSDRTPLLSWNGFEGVSGYQVSLSQDSTFITGVQQFTTANTFYQISNDLSSGTWFMGQI